MQIVGFWLDVRSAHTIVTINNHPYQLNLLWQNWHMEQIGKKSQHHSSKVKAMHVPNITRPSIHG
jgi:hypothetical protein